MPDLSHNSPQFCRMSRKFLHAKVSRPKDFGVWISWQWRRKNKKQLKWQVRSRFFVLSILCILTYAIDRFAPDFHEYSLPIALAISSAVVFYWVFEFLRWGFKSQLSRWRKFLNLEVWASLTVLASLHSIFFSADPLIFSLPITADALMILVLGIYLWIFVRWGETELFKSKLKSSFLDPALKWGDLDAIAKFSNRIDLGAFFLGLLILFVTYELVGLPDLHWLALSTLPLFLPYSQILMTCTLRCADAHRFSCQEFSYFRNLRNFRLFIFHQFGALTQGSMVIKENVIDTDDEWSKDEIKDILFRITEGSSHPVAKLIHEKYKSNKRSLVTMQQIDAKPHLGIQAEFKDIQGRATVGVLGGMTWHKVLQHEIFQETLVKLKEWKEKKYKVILLALNRKLLAMFAMSDPWRENLIEDLEAFKRDGYFTAMMSSNEDFFEISPPAQDPILERAVNLVPVERNEQKRYWLEREPRAIEVVSYWDVIDEPLLPTIICTPNREWVSAEKSAFIAPRIQDIHRVAKLSRVHHRWSYGVMALSFLLTVIFATLVSF